MKKKSDSFNRTNTLARKKINNIKKKQEEELVKQTKQQKLL